jgi:hypothetical protein
MSNEIELDEQCVRTLERYSLKGVAEIPLMIDRVVREWYSKVAMYRDAKIKRLKCMLEDFK